MHLLRLAGAPGVGKSTTAWAVANRLAGAGVATGYVDIDQLGMCYPAPDDDPDRWALKERALAGVARQFALAGIDRLVVSGVAWPDDPPPQIPGITVQSLWLDATEQTRRRRLTMRGDTGEQLLQFLSAGTAEAGRVNSAWGRIATDGLSEADAVEKVLEFGQPADPNAESDAVQPHTGPAAPATDRMLWITGPRLAGASRIGWEIVSREWTEGRRAGFIDLAQLSFAWNVDSTLVGLANLARLQRAFREVGTDRFVVVAPCDVEPAAVRVALPASDLSFVRLAPSASDIRRHARLRRSGDGPSLAGDDVADATESELEQILLAADSQSTLPEREGELSVDTRDLPLQAAAEAVKRAAGW